jgi:prolyl oligopeptidase
VISRCHRVFLVLSLVGGVVACRTAPPPPPLPPPPPPPAPPPAPEGLALLAELQDHAVFERRGDELIADPYRALERDSELVARFLEHARSRTAERWPVDPESVERVARLDAAPRARSIATLSRGHVVEVVRERGRVAQLDAEDAQASVPLTGAVAFSASPDGKLLALVLGPTEAVPSPHLQIHDWTGAVVDGPVPGVVPVPPAWEGDDVLLYALEGRGRVTVRRRFVGAGAVDDPVVLTELRDGDAVRMDAIPNGPAWIEAQRGEERTVWLRTGPVLFRKLAELPAGPPAIVVADHVVVADPAAGVLRIARSARAIRASGWTSMPLPGVLSIAACGERVLAVVRRGLGDALVLVSPTGEVRELDALGLGLVTAIDGDARGATLVWMDPRTPSARARVSIDGELTWLDAAPRLEVRRRTLQSTVGERAVSFEVAEVWSATSDASAAPSDADAASSDAEASAAPSTSPLVVVEALGAFGVSATPAFRAGVAAYLEDGGRWAFVDVRGGGGHASAWHEEGRGAGESGAVADLRAAVAALREGGARVALYGAGHGGLTASGLLTREPELVVGAVLHGPVTDLLRFDRLPNAALWRAEYGDPSDPTAWAWLRLLSPYHRVTGEGAWPTTLIEGAREGERVSWMHGAKLAARLLERDRAWLHVDARLDDAARHARWARALAVWRELAE